jgi:large conductance mechanosensitive channel
VLKEFRDFIMRGNVVDLAVAVVIGAAFGAVVTAFVSSFLTPLIGAIGGLPDFSKESFELNGSKFTWGLFVNALIAFLMIAAVVFFAVVRPMKKLQDRLGTGQQEDKPVQTCPQCLSDIPAAATRCAFCTQPVGGAAPAA